MTQEWLKDWRHRMAEAEAANDTILIEQLNAEHKEEHELCTVKTSERVKKMAETVSSLSERIDKVITCQTACLHKQEIASIRAEERDRAAKKIEELQQRSAIEKKEAFANGKKWVLELLKIIGYLTAGGGSVAVFDALSK